jgi:hypothetical protein
MPAPPWTEHTEPDADASYIVMGSRLPLRGFWFSLRFLAHSMQVRRRFAHADGLIGYALNAPPLWKEFWTVSAWRSRDDLQRFARVDPQATAIAVELDDNTGRSVGEACR